MNWVQTEVPRGIFPLLTAYPGRKRIHSALKIKVVKASTEYATERNPAERFYIENLRRVLPVLRDLGLVQVTVRFDGSGDSGSIDKAEYEPSVEPAGTQKT